MPCLCLWWSASSKKLELPYFIDERRCIAEYFNLYLFYIDSSLIFHWFKIVSLSKICSLIFGGSSSILRGCVAKNVHWFFINFYDFSVILHRFRINNACPKMFINSSILLINTWINSDAFIGDAPLNFDVFYIRQHISSKKLSAIFFPH